MARVKSKDTDIELALRSALHRRGIRFRKNVKGLPGTPDIVFTRAKLAVFVNGKFWHGYRFRKWRDGLTPFWREKIEGNRRRDCWNYRELRRTGWRVVRIWQHEIKKNLPNAVARVEKAWRKGPRKIQNA